MSKAYSIVVTAEELDTLIDVLGNFIEHNPDIDNEEWAACYRVLDTMERIRRDYAPRQ